MSKIVDGKICSDCINYNRITKDCKNAWTIAFLDGCKKCGTPQPYDYFFDNKQPCKDYMDDPELI